MPVDFAKKMTGWQKKLLEKKLAEMAKVITHRKWVTTLYAGLCKEKGIKAIDLSDDYDPNFLRYPIRVSGKERILAEAKKRRIEIGDWFLSPVHPNLVNWEKAGYQEGMCPNAEDICREIINLPTHEGINRKEVEATIDLIANDGRH